MESPLESHPFIEWDDNMLCKRCWQPRGSHMKQTIKVPQEIADEHTLVAQRYSGFFTGFETRAEQQGGGAVYVDETKPWREPVPVEDTCEFCTRMTDEDVVRRVAGYQQAIDIEVDNIYAFGGMGYDMMTFRSGVGALKLTALPMRLKRKLCIDWNHVYMRWMKRDDILYDFDSREFSKDVQVSKEFADEWMKDYDPDIGIGSKVED